MSSLTLVCGIDEAGRGPWAGPVMAAAVVLDPARPIVGLTDSKKLREKKRSALEVEIKDKALFWSVACADQTEIDAMNIRKATFLAMRRSVETLTLKVEEILIDGNAVPAAMADNARAIVKGDLKIPAISAASILAKTYRDREMVRLCAQYPGYGFSQHKGYGSAQHAAALERLGPCNIHRQSFAPVRKANANFMAKPARHA
ncbi:MAG: ribonuclease HII [Hyphomonadaceae bacterium]|nr:ribonuclease HII [Hyphomonadaceae bacterium]OUX95685.1 MAG: ribonuclease HII [Hyphomonas sp. TMED17]